MIEKNGDAEPEEKSKGIKLSADGYKELHRWKVHRIFCWSVSPLYFKFPALWRIYFTHRNNRKKKEFWVNQWNSPSCLTLSFLIRFGMKRTLRVYVRFLKKKVNWKCRFGYIRIPKKIQILPLYLNFKRMKKKRNQWRWWRIHKKEKKCLHTPEKNRVLFDFVFFSLLLKTGTAKKDDMICWSRRHRNAAFSQ